MATKSKKTAAKRATAAKGKAIKSRKSVTKAAKAAAATSAPREGTKKALLLEMLSGKGSTNTDLCKSLGWQPHTLRAAISRIENVEHSRVDGVTSYRIKA